MKPLERRRPPSGSSLRHPEQRQFKRCRRCGNPIDLCECRPMELPSAEYRPTWDRR